MAEKPANPFSNLGLDKALLRSRQQSVAQVEKTSATETATSETDAPVRARTHARTDASTQARRQGASIERLHRQLQIKQHLASQTFRFRLEELAALDTVSMQLKGGGRGRLE